MSLKFDNSLSLLSPIIAIRLRYFRFRCEVFSEIMEQCVPEDDTMKKWVVSGELEPAGKNTAPNQRKNGMKYSTKEYSGK
jgi:hypothetical protein